MVDLVGKRSMGYWACFVVLILVLERVFFQRSFFADGSCIFLEDIRYGAAFVELPNRLIAMTLMRAPFNFALLMGIDNRQILEMLWSISFVFPFFLSIAVIRLLNEKYRVYGNFFFIISIVLYYLPNSFFAVGEYNMAYPLFAILIASLKQYIDLRDWLSKAISFVALLCLAFSYEGLLLPSILGAIYLVVVDLFFFERKQMSSLIPNVVFLLILILSSYLIVNSIPDIVQSNGKKALTDYLYKPQEGAMYDTWLFFSTFVSLFLIVFLYTKFSNRKESYSSSHYLAYAIYFIFFTISLLSNHLPAHSYFSKTIYLNIYILLFLSFLFADSEKLEIVISKFSHLLIGSFFLVCAYTLSEGMKFDEYLQRFKAEIEKSPEVSIVNRNDMVEFYKDQKNKKYDWSWGHICLSEISNPSNHSVVQGPLDAAYFDNFNDVLVEHHIK